ncbi:MAG: hypothetical protein AAGK92_00805 [Pseudomonadota bacterium]
MSSEAFYKDRQFLTPAFRIKIEGREAGPELVADVAEVSFNDDLENIDSFEFVVNDWDPMALRPKYSSPWDENGVPLTQPDTGSEIPNFEPGTEVSLYFGYLEDGDLPLVMTGEVVSIAPTFPAGGAPTCRIRALNKFLRGLQKIRIDTTYDGTAKAIVDQMCRDNAVQVEWDPVEEEGEAGERVAVEGLLYDEVAKRAGEYGMTLSVLPGSEDSQPTLLISKPAGSDPVAEFEWGRTLISFTPALSTAGQFAGVTVRAGDPAAEEDQIEVTKTWSDINLAPDALGPTGTTDITTGIDGLYEVIKPSTVETEADAERAALARLTELAGNLITGSGSSIGLPQLRAGTTVKLIGLGARFSGVYRITKSTHALGGSGYLTNFSARKEVL